MYKQKQLNLADIVKACISWQMNSMKVKRYYYSVFSLSNSITEEIRCRKEDSFNAVCNKNEKVTQWGIFNFFFNSNNSTGNVLWIKKYECSSIILVFWCVLQKFQNHPFSWTVEKRNISDMKYKYVYSGMKFRH